MGSVSRDTWTASHGPGGSRDVLLQDLEAPSSKLKALCLRRLIQKLKLKDFSVSNCSLGDRGEQT